MATGTFGVVVSSQPWIVSLECRRRGGRGTGRLIVAKSSATPTGSRDLAGFCVLAAVDEHQAL
jgi:hypothetical protein